MLSSSAASANQIGPTFSLRPNWLLASSSDCGGALQFLFSSYSFRSRSVFLRTWHGRRGGFLPNRGFRVFCESKVILEHPFLRIS
ncbi:hypothetical protein ACFX13_032362 [Malus domestica]